MQLLESVIILLVFVSREFILSEGTYCKLRIRVVKAIESWGQKLDFCFQGCPTIGGPAQGNQCIFPFIFEGISFTGCITRADPDKIPWCSTKIDENGTHVGGNKFWAHCDLGECPISDDPLAKGPVEALQPKVELETFLNCETSNGKTGFCKPTSLCIGVSENEVISNKK